MKQYFRMDMPNTLVKSDSEMFEQAVLQRVEVIRNHMLGDFNEDGVYVIDGGIQNELLRMHKYLVERYDTQCLIESECIFDKRLYFSLKVEDNVVTFSLLEKMRYGTNHESKSPYCNIHTTVLDQAYLKRKPKNLEELLFKRYNISIADTPTALDVYEMSADEVNEYFNTINRKFMVAEKERELNAKAEILEEIEREYYLETIHALKKSGAYGKQVIGQMEQNMITVRPFINPKKPGYYKGLNQILSTVIQSNRNEENKEQVAVFEEKIEKPRKIYAEQLKKVVPVVVPAIVDPVKRQEKLEEVVERITANQSEEVKEQQVIRQAKKQEQVAQATKGRGKTKSANTEPQIAGKKTDASVNPKTVENVKPAEVKAVTTPAVPKPTLTKTTVSETNNTVKVEAKQPVVAPTKAETKPEVKPESKSKQVQPAKQEQSAKQEKTEKSKDIKPVILDPSDKKVEKETAEKKGGSLIDKIVDAKGDEEYNYDSEIFGKKINNNVDAQDLQKQAQEKFRKEQEKKKRETPKQVNVRKSVGLETGEIDERRTGVNFTSSNVSQNISEDGRSTVQTPKNPNMHKEVRHEEHVSQSSR